MKPLDPPSPLDPEEEVLRHRVKGELRKQMRAIRRALPVEARARRAAEITRRVLDREEFLVAGCLLSFVPLRTEVDTAAIVDAARARGARIVLPRVDVEADALVLHDHLPGAALEEGGFGVPEPLPTAPRVDPADVDFVLVPALAIDPRGHRIGYGKGFYDRLLPMLSPHATRCALAFDFQLIAEIPITPGDEPVDLVITDTRVLETFARRDG